MSNQSWYTQHPKKSLPILCLPSVLTIQLWLKVCHWALCPPTWSGQSITPKTLNPLYCNGKWPRSLSLILGICIWPTIIFVFFFHCIKPHVKRRVFRLEKKLGGIWTRTGELEQHWYRRIKGLVQNSMVCEKAHLPLDTIWMQFLLLPVASNLNPDKNPGEGSQSPC